MLTKSPNLLRQVHNKKVLIPQKLLAVRLREILFD